MRDPNRINKFCDELKALWHCVPDMRFGQFMYAMLRNYDVHTGTDSFYAEDDELMAFFKKYIGGYQSY